EVVAQLIGPRVELQAAGLVHQVGEARLAMVTQRHQPPGPAHRPHRFELLVGSSGEALVQRAGPVADRVASAEGVETAPAQRLELVVALAGLLGVVAPPDVAHACWLRDHKRYALMKSSMSPSITASTLPISTPVRWSLIRCSGWNVEVRIW